MDVELNMVLGASLRLGESGSRASSSGISLDHEVALCLGMRVLHDVTTKNLWRF